MKRRDDWQMKLSDYLVAIKTPEYKFGKMDCCTFCFGAVEAMTDVDMMAEFRGKYSSRVGAAKALKKYGEGNLYDTMLKHFGADPVPASQASRGDLCFDGERIGIILGRHTIYLGETGFLLEPITAGHVAFKVPFE